MAVGWGAVAGDAKEVPLTDFWHGVQLKQENQKLLTMQALKKKKEEEDFVNGLKGSIETPNELHTSIGATYYPELKKRADEYFSFSALSMLDAYCERKSLYSCGFCNAASIIPSWVGIGKSAGSLFNALTLGISEFIFTSPVIS